MSTSSERDAAAAGERAPGGRFSAGGGRVGDGSRGAPGVESLAGLVGVDPWLLDAGARVELVAEFERHAAWFEGVRARALAAAAGPGPDFGPQPGDADCAGFTQMYAVDDAVVDEVSLALRCSPVTTRRRVTVARDLLYKLPVTAGLLRAGVCSYGQAAVISDECERLSVLQAGVVEAGALGRVGVQTPGQTRRSVRGFIARLFPPAPAGPEEGEFARRSVSLSFDGSVMATITATLPAPDAMVVWNALTACARAGVPVSPSCATATADAAPAEAGDAGEAGADPGAAAGSAGPGVVDRRSMAHKRADALTAWAYRAGDDPGVPVMQGKKRLEAQVVIDVATLLGLAQSPAELVGYGPIPAALGRRLAAHAGSWRRLVTDPVGGHLLDYGMSRYVPPARLREYVLARDRVCQFPTCQRTGYQCDLDHVEAFTGTADGGVTSAGNLLTLCRRHHRLKTHNRWRIRIVDPPDGGGVPIVEWTTARGLVFRRPRPTQLEPDLPRSSDLAEPTDTGTDAVPTPAEAHLKHFIHAA